MDNLNKGRSPFYPGQPVPVEFFIGRLNEIERITRAIKQVELGKPQAIFLTGEYGIGKSSLAGFMKYYAEKNNHLLGIHVLLGGADSLEEVAAKTVEAAIKSEACEPTTTEKIRDLLAKYVGKQEFIGINLNLDALKTDAPGISHGYLPFLRELTIRLEDHGIKGLMLILDEINGIARNEKFAHFIKALVDENALSTKPLPLLLMLCGVEERRREMIQNHQPIERIFEIVEIKPMDISEMTNFYNKAFISAGMTINDEALSVLNFNSAGFPKIMHLIGDAVFWENKDYVVDKKDAIGGIIFAIDEIGRRFVDQQVYKALHSADYRSILNKISKMEVGMSFHKSIIEKELSDAEKRKFSNFLQKMKKLNVLKAGDQLGEYTFNSSLVRLYIIFNKIQQK